MKTVLNTFVLFVLLSLVTSNFGFSQHLPFQGKLLEDGQPVNGMKSFEFSINQNGVNWSETHAEVPVNNGLYALVLGSITPLPSDLFATQAPMHLYISVEGTPLDTVPVYPPIEADPTIPGYIKDGITWSEINNIPASQYADTSATNELQQLSIQGNQLSLSDGNTVEIPVIADSTVIDGSMVIKQTFQAGVNDTVQKSICQSQAANDYPLKDTAWQSFTAIHNGTLDQIDLDFGNGFNTDIKLTIYPGHGTSGQPIWSKTYSKDLFSIGISMQSIIIDEDAILLSFGQVFTFQLVGISNGIFIGITEGNPYHEGHSSLGDETDLRFCLTYTTVNAIGVYVDEDGNVGIGTDDPQARLDIRAKEEFGNDNAVIVSNATGSPVVEISNEGNTSISGNLDVNGNTIADGDLDITGDLNITGNVFPKMGFTNMQVFTSSGTWIKPDGVTRVFVKVVGGGGGSGIAQKAFGGPEYSSGGGGGGGYAEKFVSVYENIDVTVGIAGGGGFTGGWGLDGQDGGESSFGSYVSASGGSGSLAASTTNTVGGDGGVGTNGDLNFTGETGYDTGGRGGDSLFGWGGNDKNGTGYGGGGGGVVGTSTIFKLGHSGSQGVVIIYW